MTDGHIEKANELNILFGFKKTLVQRAEHSIHHEIRKRIPVLMEMPCAIDEDAVAKLCGKSKTLRSYRPDGMYVDQRTRVGLHLEIDETPDHEDDDNRLRAIHESLDMLGRVYVIRIHAHLYDALRMCTRKTKRNGTTFYIVNSRGNEVIDVVEDYIRKVLVWMSNGVVPNDDRQWKAVFGK